MDDKHFVDRQQGNLQLQHLAFYVLRQKSASALSVAKGFNSALRSHNACKARLTKMNKTDNAFVAFVRLFALPSGLPIWNTY